MGDGVYVLALEGNQVFCEGVGGGAGGQGLILLEGGFMSGNKRKNFL